jgi:hypothetical protein
MLNTPIIEDKLAGRVVFSVGSVSGNVKDITTGAELNGEHKWAARGSLNPPPQSCRGSAHTAQAHWSTVSQRRLGAAADVHLIA